MRTRVVLEHFPAGASFGPKLVFAYCRCCLSVALPMITSLLMAYLKDTMTNPVHAGSRKFGLAHSQISHLLPCSIVNTDTSGEGDHSSQMVAPGKPHSKF